MIYKAAFTFARMNPPTIGHERIVDCLHKMFTDSARFIFLSPTRNNYNPLTFVKKFQYCEEAFGDRVCIFPKPQKDFFAAIIQISNIGYDEIDIVVGSDRYEELSYRVQKYNGILYNFEKIKVYALIRDDLNLASSMSATKMRIAAIKNDYAFFESGLPQRLRPKGTEIFEEVRKCLTEKTLMS